MTRTVLSGPATLDKAALLLGNPRTVQAGKAYTLSVSIGGTYGDNVTILAEQFAGDGSRRSQWQGTAVQCRPGESRRNVDLIVIPEPGVTKMQFMAFRYNDQSYSQPMGLHSAEWAEGIDPKYSETPKRSFKGNRGIAIDDLGNFTIDDAPYFPIGICTGGRSAADMAMFKNQGFNVETWSAEGFAGKIGMATGLNLSQYCLPTKKGGWAYGNMDLLRRVCATLPKDVLWGYLDCEEMTGTMPKVQQTIETFKDVMPGVPVFVLNGNIGLQALGDVTGTYVQGGDNAQGKVGLGGQLALSRLSDVPSSIAQIQTYAGEMVATRFWGAIAHGCRGASIWMDNNPTLGAAKAETTKWWPDIPRLRKEVDKIIDVIRAPTNPLHVKVTLSNDNIVDPVAFGWRSTPSGVYLIAANQTLEPQRFSALVNAVSDNRPVIDWGDPVDALTGQPINVQKIRTDQGWAFNFQLKPAQYQVVKLRRMLGVPLPTTPPVELNKPKHPLITQIEAMSPDERKRLKDLINGA